MIPSLLYLLPLVVLVSLTHGESSNKTNRLYRIEVTVTKHGLKIGPGPHRVNLNGDVEENKPLKLSVNYNTTNDNIYEVVEIDVNVSTILGMIGKPEYEDVPTVTCSEGYELVEGVSCYKTSERYKNWREAVKSCEDEGARLATADTRRKLQVLLSFALRESSTTEGTPIWLGIHKKNGTWQTLDGAPVDPSGWLGTVPDGNKECGTVMSGVLHDHYCNYVQGFVCEKPLKFINNV